MLKAFVVAVMTAPSALWASTLVIFASLAIASINHQLARALALRLHPPTREVITTSKELSIRLAELARAIRDRIKTALAIETERGPLTKLMKAFQEALVHDLDADGFADMYAQTMAYGLLSARVADPTAKTADDFAAHMRTNPFLKELMETFLNVGGRHGRRPGGRASTSTSSACPRSWSCSTTPTWRPSSATSATNRQEDPVIHFYELFLKEYDERSESGAASSTPRAR